MEILSFSYSIWLIIILLIGGGVIAYITGKLTLSASAGGVIIALLLYGGTGLTSLAMLAAFFILGTAVTSYKREYKLNAGLVERHEERRNLGQVLANAGVAAILSALSLLLETNNSTLLVMIAASFASATGDTFSSELGNVHGRNFYNITSFKKDERGLNGVISLEGSLFGTLGSTLIAFIYIIGVGGNFISFVIIIISGVAGNLLDSLLGALFERKGRLGNDTVNFLNTVFAALFALLLLLGKSLH